MSGAAPLILHASAVALDGRGVLIRGASGSGKSMLALALMARGANLIADDRTCLAKARDGVIAWSPETILGRIEARGIGLLRADPAPPTPLALIVDLDRIESDRLPPLRQGTVAGIRLPMIRGAGHPALADPVMQLLRVPAPITA